MSKVKTKQQTNYWFEKILARPYQIIFLVCVLLYAQILTFSLVHFDDHGFVLMASDTLKFYNIPEFFSHSVFWVLGDSTQDTDIFYRPLQNVFYSLCNTISPKQPWGYHLAGLMLHILVSGALYNFLKELKYHASVSLLFALIYSVHPVLVQGVAWIAGMGDQMAALFSLLSLICFIKLVCPNPAGSTGRVFSPSALGLLHLLFLTLALFSKEISIALILLCISWYFMINKNKSKGKMLLISALGWIAISTAYFIFRSNAIHPPKINLFTSAVESFKVNGPLIFEYFEKIFFPFRLSPIPSREDAQFYIGGIVVLALAALFIFSVTRRSPSILVRQKYGLSQSGADRKRFTPLDKNQNPTWFTRMSLFGALWFVVFLFPTFIQQNPQAHFFAFEHRLYLPLIGILIFMMELLPVKQINIQSGVQKYSFASVLALFFGIAFFHSRTFTDPYTFYDKAIASSPQSVIAYNGYGKLLLEDKKYVEAIEAFKKSHQYKPDDLQTTGKIAEIYLKNLNNPRDAISWFKKTFDIDSNSVEAAVSIGDSYYNFLHDTANAISWYNKAVKINPGNEFALANLGLIYASKGKNNEARNFLTQSLAANPKNILALKWMAISFFNEGKISDAVIYLNKAYEFYPRDVDLQRNLMICYYKINDFKLTEKFASIYSHNNNQIPDEISDYLKKGGH